MELLKLKVETLTALLESHLQSKNKIIQMIVYCGHEKTCKLNQICSTAITITIVNF